MYGDVVKEAERTYGKGRLESSTPAVARILGRHSTQSENSSTGYGAEQIMKSAKLP